MPSSSVGRMLRRRKKYVYTECTKRKVLLHCGARPNTIKKAGTGELKMLYTAVLIFETISDSSSYQPLYSEEFVAVEASSEDDARTNAIAQAKASEHSYQNQDNETINVKFKTLIDVQEPVDENALSGEGTIYVRHFRDYPAYEAFEPFLKGKTL